ncbi:unnamed protein product, partial [Didymodactylos carnosus]
IEAHQHSYDTIFDESRFKRGEKKRTQEHKKFENLLDIGIRPGNGLQSPKISIEDVEASMNKSTAPQFPNWKWRMPTTGELAEQEQTLLNKPIKEGLSSLPTTQKEKNDCAVLLSPSQLFQVVVGPPELNFGEVAVHAPVTKYLSVMNNLDQYIQMQIDVRSNYLFIF